MRKLMFIVIVCAFMATPAMADLYVSVPGKACPYFAGQTYPVPMATTGDSWNYHLDRDDPGTMPPWVDVTGFGGTIPSITATGTWGHPPLSGPDGYGSYDPTHQEYIDLGISPVINTPLNALIGVFLTDATPVAFSAPSSLTFGVSDMTSPLLQQTFVIGSSLQNITIPSGATRLFFGLNNGYEWTNNVGALDVSVVPAPAAVLLGMIGLSVAGVKLRKFA